MAMKLNISLIRRIFWPERASLFVVIGGAAGMAGDMINFFTDIISAGVLTAIFAAVAAVCVLLCLQRALLVDASNQEDVKKVVNCGVCDAMRFSLFAAAAFTILLLIGQGRSATENVAEMLGLMQRDVAQIAADVSDLSDIAQSQKLVANPRNAADYFRNAWIQTNVRRDAVAAHKAMEDMFNRFGPRKMDAAEMYYNTGRQVKARRELMARMEELAQARKDPTLLVVAARNAGDAAESARLMAAARDIAPDYPFAHWDMMNMNAAMGRANFTDLDAQLAQMEQQVADIEKFLALLAEHPAGHYFFLPQYQPDFDMTVRQTLTSLRTSSESMRTAQQAAAKAQRAADRMQKGLPLEDE